MYQLLFDEKLRRAGRLAAYDKAYERAYAGTKCGYIGYTSILLHGHECCKAAVIAPAQAGKPKRPGSFLAFQWSISSLLAEVMGSPFVWTMKNRTGCSLRSTKISI